MLILGKATKYSEFQFYLLGSIHSMHSNNMHISDNNIYLNANKSIWCNQQPLTLPNKPANIVVAKINKSANVKMDKTYD